jgi:hypothetical protein
MVLSSLVAQSGAIITNRRHRARGDPVLDDAPCILVMFDAKPAAAVHDQVPATMCTLTRSAKLFDVIRIRSVHLAFPMAGKRTRIGVVFPF